MLNVLYNLAFPRGSGKRDPSWVWNLVSVDSAVDSLKAGGEQVWVWFCAMRSLGNMLQKWILWSELCFLKITQWYVERIRERKAPGKETSHSLSPESRCGTQSLAEQAEEVRVEWRKKLHEIGQHFDIENEKIKGSTWSYLSDSGPLKTFRLSATSVWFHRLPSPLLWLGKPSMKCESVEAKAGPAHIPTVSPSDGGRWGLLGLAGRSRGCKTKAPADRVRDWRPPTPVNGADME